MAGRSVLRLVRDFVENQLEALYVADELDQDEFVALARSLSHDDDILRLRNRLLAAKGHAVHEEDGSQWRLIELREMTLSTFPFIHYLPPRSDTRSRKQLVCFVGHRFHPNYDRTLRFNLRSLLAPFAITPRWAGFDLGSTQLFPAVIKQLTGADFCIFDNRGTLNRPNVYIEAGIAFARERPTIFCEFDGRGAARDTGSLPSDFRGLLTCRYRNYKDLCHKLYHHLPSFLRTYNLRSA